MQPVPELLLIQAERRDVGPKRIERAVIGALVPDTADRPVLRRRRVVDLEVARRAVPEDVVCPGPAVAGAGIAAVVRLKVVADDGHVVEQPARAPALVRPAVRAGAVGEEVGDDVGPGDGRSQRHRVIHAVLGHVLHQVQHAIDADSRRRRLTAHGRILHDRVIDRAELGAAFDDDLIHREAVAGDVVHPAVDGLVHRDGSGGVRQIAGAQRIGIHV